MISSSPDSASRRRRGLWLILLVLLWELVRILGRVDPLLMPPVSAVLRSLADGVLRGHLLSRWAVSMALVAGGLFAGTLGALVLTLAARAHPSVASFLSLLSGLMHPLPGLALMPLVILWIGTGASAVLVIAIHAVVWPIFVNLESGIRALAPAWTVYARNLGLGRFRTFLHIALPGAFPHLASGIRIGWARSWRACIAAEMVFGAVGAAGGLGWQLFEGRTMMDTPLLYAALVAVMLTGMAVEDGILDRWEHAVRAKWGEAP